MSESGEYERYRSFSKCKSFILKQKNPVWVRWIWQPFIIIVYHYLDI